MILHNDRVNRHADRRYDGTKDLEVFRSHGMEPKLSWENGAQVDFMFVCSPVPYRESKSGRVVSAIPTIHRWGPVTPQYISIEVQGVLRTEKGLLYAHELDEHNGDLKDILRKDVYTSDGASEGPAESIEKMILGIEEKLSRLKQMG